MQTEGFRHSRRALGALIVAIPQPASAKADSVSAGNFHLRSPTCEAPVRLSRDCSIREGATRPIALGAHCMLLAANEDGVTLLVSRLRLCPDHNDIAFVADEKRSVEAIIRQISAKLEGHKIYQQHRRPVRNGRKIAAWLLEFSGNAYGQRKQLGVLELEYWLPDQSPW
ncbi:MAG: hypothetical protein KDI82_03520 [Gammaproteobacteria bacterium]|nr:hypothetical protein [Gammaproteobacteria bacterium]